MLDGLDGRVARITKTTSDFGAQYDSLSDAISFGVAPSIFLYQWFLKDVNFVLNSWLELGVIIASLYLVSVLLRLARFNTSKSSDFFIGLPCPIGAILVSLAYIVFSKTNISILQHKDIGIIFTLLIAFLMISKFSYFSFKNIGNEVGGAIKGFFYNFITCDHINKSTYGFTIISNKLAPSGFVFNIYRISRKRKSSP